MLYDIQPAANAANSTIVLHVNDNVAIARVALSPGNQIEVGGTPIDVTTAVPAGHKVATRAILVGNPVFRYGEIIGYATEYIKPGDHVHVHNLAFAELDHHDFRLAAPGRTAERRVSTESFLGYKRKDRRVGTRNYIAVVAASNCAAHASELIAASFGKLTLPENVVGIVAFPHGEGC